MQRAIMIGAGNIGRGFIGALLAKSGYQVLFADVNQSIIDAINKCGFFESIPLWAVTLLGSIFITILSFCFH